MHKQNGRFEHNGVEYIHGATHAGLDCWVKPGYVDGAESCSIPVGDRCSDELVRYLADPDGYRRSQYLITDERGKVWPLRNTHRDRGGTTVAKAPSHCAQPEAERGDTHPAPVPPADEYEPVGTVPVVGDRVVDLRRPKVALTVVRVEDRSIIKSDGYVVGYGVFCDRPECHEHRILKRQPARGEDSWRVWSWAGSCTYTEVEINGRCYFEASDGKGKWVRDDTPLHRQDPERCTELRGPEREAVISSFKASGVAR